MKKLFIVVALAVLAVLAGLTLVFCAGIHEARAIEKVNEAWRKAAAPVFEARRVGGLADQATPRDLSAALDVNSVMTRSETYKWGPHYATGRTKITISPTD